MGGRGRGRVEAGVALNTVQNKSERKILVVSQEVISADFFMAHVLKYSKYGNPYYARESPTWRKCSSLIG